MSTSRTEAFSDGVFAVAITLLILSVQAQRVPDGKLARALWDLWPAYASYVVSFVTIGIIWVNHHGMFRILANVNRTFLFLNLFFLMTVVFIPFPTALLGEYIGTGVNSHIAAAVYSGTMTAMGVAFGGMWLYIGHHHQLLREHVNFGTIHTSTPRFTLGTAIYALSIGIAFINAYACLVIYAALALYYVFDQLAVEPSTTEEEAAGE